MLRVAICDDMTSEQDHTAMLLSEYQRNHDIDIEFTRFNNGFLFLEALNRKEIFDICFLDIYMPGLTGIDVAKELRQMDRVAQIVFTTSSREFALEGYKVQASNYLVKPVDKVEFDQAMDEVMRKLEPGPEDYVCLTTKEGVERIQISRIVLVEADKNNAIITLCNKEKRQVTMTFGSVCELLGSRENFYPVSRSALVNFEGVVGSRDSGLLMEIGCEVPVPRRKKQEIVTAFLDFHTNHT